MRWLCLVLLLTGISAGTAHAQGCSQCREAVGQQPVATQKAYRDGILVLLGAVAAVCGATLLVVRRFR
jgi:hypothetical protein